MNQSQRRSITLICGVSGSGKTTFALRYLLNVPDVLCRFLWDADGELSARLRLPPADTASELESDLASGWVLYDPHRMFPGDLETGFAFFCDWVFTVAGRRPGRKIFLVDEVWKYCSPQSLPLELSLCIQTGRKRQLEMLFCTQRPNRLNEAITNEVSELVCFRLQGDNALRVVENLGAPGQTVSSLFTGDFIALNCDTGGRLNGNIFAT